MSGARALILSFALEDLRGVFAHRAPSPGDPPADDPRSDTAPFRAFRAALLDAAVRCGRPPLALSFWWEGTFNGYALAVAVEPDDAAPALAMAIEATCPVESVRVAAPREMRYALGSVSSGGATVARDDEGHAFEAPFGAPTGHFGAPGVRRLR